MDLAELCVVVEKTDGEASHLDYLLRGLTTDNQPTTRLTLSGKEIIKGDAHFFKVAVNTGTMEPVLSSRSSYELQYNRPKNRIDVYQGWARRDVDSVSLEELPISKLIGDYLFTLCHQSEVEDFLDGRTLNKIRATLTDLKRLDYGKDHPIVPLFGQTPTA